MIDLFALWEKFIGSVNMAQGGAVKPHRNFVHWANDVSISMYEEKFLAWERDQKVIDDISRPFLMSVNVPVKDVPGANYGELVFPADYGHFSSIRFYTTDKGVATPIPGKPLCDCKGNIYELKDCPDFLDAEIWEVFKSQDEAKKEEGPEVPTGYKEYMVDKVPNSRWGALMEHRFLYPRKDRPKVTDMNKGLKVAPVGVGMMVLDYLKKPRPATFEYKVTPGNTQTVDGDVIVYDEANSKPLEWSELVINEFVDRLGAKYGKFVRDPQMFQMSESDREKKV